MWIGLHVYSSKVGFKDQLDLKTINFKLKKNKCSINFSVFNFYN